jgi:hypothetical protein
VSIVAQLERGVIRDPRMETLRALASALGTTLDALAGHQAEGTPTPTPHDSPAKPVDAKPTASSSVSDRHRAPESETGRARRQR